MKKYALILSMLFLVHMAFSQDGRIMEQVEAQKVAFFTQTLDLTAKESQSFWPVYNAYQEEERALKKQYRESFKNRNMGDAEAAIAIADYFELQERELSLKKQLYAELKDIIPPSKLVKLNYAEQQFKQKLLERIKKRRESRR